MKTQTCASALAIVILVLLFSGRGASADTPEQLLFVYDTIDESSRFFIQAIRDRLRETAFVIDEVAVENADVDSVGKYDCIVVYSRVMALNMRSPVRKWIRSKKDFKKTRMVIFVTANRWFEEKRRKELTALAGRRNATVVDAVSMATNTLTAEQKRRAVKENLKLD